MQTITTNETEGAVGADELQPTNTLVHDGLATSFKLGERMFSPEEVAQLAVALGLDRKASRPTVLDLRSLGAFSNYFAILSAANGRQVVAVAEGIRMYFKKTFGVSPLSNEGHESQHWILLDYGFLFVHVFQDATREKYGLEQLWSKARLVPCTEGSANALLTEAKELDSALRPNLDGLNQV
jgi:ribosome-associated protein